MKCLLVALALAYGAAVSAEQPRIAVEESGSAGDPLIASVNGHEVRLSHVYKQVEGLPLGQQIDARERLRGFAEAVIREEILFQAMLATDFAGEPALRDRVRGIVVEHLVDRHVSSRLDVTDADVAAYYAENQSTIRFESVRASQIVLAERADCDALVRELTSAEAFTRVARERSLDRASGERGGDIGYFMNHTGPLGFEPALFALRPGEMRVFVTDAGCHLVRVTEHELPPLPPLADVAERIRALLRREREIALLRDLFARAGSVVRVERPASGPSPAD